MTRAIEQLPPPISAVRHFHWLGAVQAYTATLSGDGVPFRPRLQDDDANRVFETLFEIQPEKAARAENEWPAETADWKVPVILADTIGTASVVITLDGLVNEVRTLKSHGADFSSSLNAVARPRGTGAADKPPLRKECFFAGAAGSHCSPRPSTPPYPTGDINLRSDLSHPLTTF